MKLKNAIGIGYKISLHNFAKLGFDCICKLNSPKTNLLNIILLKK